MTERPRLYPVDSRFEDKLWCAAAPRLSLLHAEILKMESWITQWKEREGAQANPVRALSG